MPELIDLTGRKFGKLTVVCRVENNKHGQPQWKCICDCGNETVVVGQKLRKGITKSCGCLVYEQKTRLKHGMTGTVLHNRWLNMKSRCYNKNNKSYCRYGARGITICEQWHDFKNFYNWAMENGFSEELSLDRIDNGKGYSPDNCRWATPIQQANNTRRNVIVEYNGEKKTVSEHCRDLGLNYNNVIFRLENGVPAKDAFSKEYKRRKPERDKYFKDLQEKSEKAGIKYKTVWTRIFKYGWSEEKALSTPVKEKK